MKTAIVTGTTGQTASILTENLLNQNYKVYGMLRRSSNFNTKRIDHIYNHPNLKLFYGDLTDAGSINSIVSDVKPDYFYNLGAMSFVKASFEIPEFTFSANTIGVIHCLEAIKKLSPNTRFLQASTSEQFGNAPMPAGGYTESCSMIPESPYGISKLAAFGLVKNYREAYGLFAVNAISFNHEGKKRSENFVTRKITRAATRIKAGLQDKLILGNLNAFRDFTHYDDVSKGQQMILEADEPNDFILASGKAYSIQEFLELVFQKLDLDWKKYVEISETYYRPTEVNYLCGNFSKIKNKLGWEPKISFDCMVNEMIENDTKLCEQEIILNNNGFKYNL